MAGWGGGVAAACLTVISLWRWQDGQVGWALLLLTLAFVQLAVVAQRARRRGAAGPAGPAGAPGAPDVEHARRHLVLWRLLGGVGMLGALATVAVAPPLALALAGAGVYAAWQARSRARAAVAA